MLTAEQSFARLVAGNERYVNRQQRLIENSTVKRMNAVAEAQSPFAVILSCADSRVPPEIVFDQGLGDLFVVRVAGNIVDAAVLGSIEFAVSQLGTKLVVVLGHTECGAVNATVSQVLGAGGTSSGAELPQNLCSIVDKLRPAVLPLMAQLEPVTPQLLAAKAIRANVCASSAQVTMHSGVMADAKAHGGLVVVGAEYDLKTGIVDFFSEVPEAWLADAALHRRAKLS